MDQVLFISAIGLLVLLVLAVVMASFLAYQYFSLKSQITTRLTRELEMWREKELKPALKEQSESVRKDALEQLAQWRGQELELARKQQLETARSEAKVQLEFWKQEQERAIRQDAIQKSQSVTVGKVTEHMVPYLPGFSFNPKDARFLGSPIDFVIFDGLNDGEVRKVVFLEVKTGSSSLSSRERRVRDAVEAGKVEWLELRPVVESGDNDKNNLKAVLLCPPTIPKPSTTVIRIITS